MYEIKPMSVRGFLDEDIRFPRFQRPSVWSDKKRFNLALSLFKGYPLGFVVLKVGEDERGHTRKFLLDGRQRREALKQLVDPASLWQWARPILKIGVSTSADELAANYWTHVVQYFGDDAEDTADQVASDSARPEEEVYEGFSYKGERGLAELLEVLKAVHPVTKKRGEGTYNGITRPFKDFISVYTDYAFVTTDSETARPVIDSKLLTQWLLETLKQISQETGPREALALALKRPSFSDVQRTQVDEILRKNWSDIETAVRAVRLLDERMRGTDLGYLELKGTEAHDDQKVFELLNSAGTQLNAIEILSAKPSWNIEVPAPDGRLKAAQQAMYTQQMGMPYENVVRWDVPATLAARLDLPEFFSLKHLAFKTSTTLGFKIMAGFYSGDVTRKAIAELASQPNLPWGARDFDRLLEKACHAAMKSEILRFLAEWRVPLVDLTSDAVATCYIVALAKDFQRKQEPTSGRNLDQYVRNAQHLLDRLLYEYATLRWRGSSDSRIASTLKQLVSSDIDVWPKLDDEVWERLAQETVEKGTIDGQTYLTKVDPRIKALVLYDVALRKKVPRGSGSLEWDHVIPQAMFDGSGNKELKHHIANLVPIPGSANNEKRDEPPSRVRSDWILGGLSDVLGVDITELSGWSSISDWNRLRQLRGAVLQESLTDYRKAMLSAGTR